VYLKPKYACVVCEKPSTTRPCNKDPEPGVQRKKTHIHILCLKHTQTPSEVPDVLQACTRYHECSQRLRGRAHPPIVCLSQLVQILGHGVELAHAEQGRHERRPANLQVQLVAILLTALDDPLGHLRARLVQLPSVQVDANACIETTAFSLLGIFLIVCRMAGAFGVDGLCM
jgi:hypothetical protein